MIVMDVSGSMGYGVPTKLSQAQTAANSFIDNLRSDDQSGLVSFSWTATLNKGLSNDHAATKSVIDGLVAGGATNISDALDKANQELISVASAPNVAKIEIFLTDGIANRPNGDGSRENPADVALALAESLEAAENGIRIFAVGLGSDVNKTMLQTMANNTNGSYYFAPTNDDLAGIFNQIASETCRTAIYVAPPIIIFNSRIAAVSNTSASVSWYTNISATSRVVYDTVSHASLGTAPNYGYAYSTDENSNKVIFHSFTITGLIPSTAYYWRPVSHTSPEEVQGEEMSFSTAATEEIGGPTGPTGGTEEGAGGIPEEVVPPEEGGQPITPPTPPIGEAGGGGQGGLGAFLAAIGNFFNLNNLCAIINLILVILVILGLLAALGRNRKLMKDKRLRILFICIAIAAIIILFYLQVCWLAYLLVLALIALIPLLRKKEVPPQL